MKCPTCLFVSSDLRDICPKCLLDLRPAKKALKLPISFPKATYDELVAKVQKKELPKVEAKKVASTLLGKLESFLTPTPVKKSDAPQKTTETNPFPKSTPPVQSKKEGLTLSIIKEANPLQEKEASVILEEKAAPADEEKADVKHDAELEKAYDALMAKAAEEEALPAPALSLPKIEIKEEPSEMPAPTPTIPPRTIVAFQSPQNDIESMFTEVYTALPSDNAAVDLSFEQLGSLKGDEHVELLFQMAEESFTNAAILEKFNAAPPSSETREVVATAAARQLEIVTKLSEAPGLSIKKGSGAPLSSPSRPLLAPFQTRLRAALYDGALGVILSIVASLSVLFLSDSAPSFLWSSEAWPDLALIDLLQILTLSIALYPFVTLAYISFAFGIQGKTLGTSSMRIRITTEEGGQVARGLLVARALLIPAGLVSLGFLPLKNGLGSSWDTLTGTRVVI